MLYEGLPGLDLFANHRQATAFLQKKYTLKSKTRVYALLGYIVSERSAHLLVATKIRNEGDLLGAHPIYMVLETTTHKAEGDSSGSSSCDSFTPLSNSVGGHIPTPSQQQSPASREASETLSSILAHLQNYPLEGTHYYCETYDLTAVFPATSSSVVTSEFAWNEWMRRPFETSALGHLCVVLLQGYAAVKHIAPSNSSICYLMKRSKINPETYLHGHGLNERSGAANEYECEIIMWKSSPTISWASHVWRRGTVPLWWRSRAKNAGTDIYLKDSPFEHADTYFASLAERYASFYSGNRTSLPTLHLVNLLRTEDSQEAALTLLFQNLCERVMSLVNINLNLISFDWLASLRSTNQMLSKTVQSMWTTLKEPIESAGFSRGTARLVHEEPTSPASSADGSPLINGEAQAAPSDHRIVHDNITHQREIIRYNCLESLERVNIATYFASFQVVSQMGKSLGLGFNDLYGFNHVTLDFMNSTLKKMGMFVPLTEFFFTSTDVCNILYLNNLAPPAPIMREYINGVSTSSTSHLLSLKRKYDRGGGAHSEEARNIQYLLFLGRYGAKFFPFNQEQHVEKPSQWISSPPSTAIKALPTLLSKSALNSSILVREIDDFCWIFPNEMHEVEVVVYLGQPSIVTELCLTVAHGTNTDTYPQSMDVHLGSYLNDTHLVMADVEIPRCTTGTRLAYQLSRYPWEQFSDVQSDVAQERFVNRVVRIVFRGAVAPLTIGKIEVFGHHSNRAAKKTGLKRINNNNNNNSNSTGSDSRIDKSSHDSHDSLRSDSANNLVNMDDDQRTNINSNDHTNAQLIDAIVENQIQGILGSLENDAPKSRSEDAIVVVKVADSMDTDPQVYFLDDVNNATDSQQSEHDSGEILVIRDYSAGTTFMEESNQELAETMFINTSGSTGSLLKETPARQYQAAVKRLLTPTSMSNANGSNHFQKLTLIEVLELDVRRITLGLSPFERDSVLRSLGLAVHHVNPQRFLFEREERIEAIIRKNTKYKSSICQRPQCGKPLGYLDMIRHKQCPYCYKRFCPSCISPSPVQVLEYEATRAAAVCNTCATLIGKQEICFKRISDANMHFNAERESIQLSFFQKVLVLFQQQQHNASSHPSHSFDSLSKSLIPLSEYPKAGILNSVPTDPLSPPIETILLPPGILPLSMFWSAPSTVNSVDITIVMAFDALVYSITMLVDSLGYNNYNLPLVEIKIGKTLSDELETVGPWARVISLRLTLPSLPTFLAYDNNEPSARPFLHVGRIAVHGAYSDSLCEIPSFLSSSIPLENSDKELYENTMYASSSIKNRNPIIKIIASPKPRGIHIVIDTSVVVKGFSVIISHDETEGVRSQIKGTIISCVVVNQKNECQSHQYVTQVVVPKSRVNSTLYFDLPALPALTHMLMFEFTSNYGGNIFSLPKVNLY
eukprot:gene8034-9438_t